MKHIFLTIPSGSNPGLTSVSIGLIRVLERNGINAGFYKPFSQSHTIGEEDFSGQCLREITELTPPKPIPLSKLEDKLHEGNIDQILEVVIETVDELLVKHDVIVLEGLLPIRDLSIDEKLNTSLSRSLNAEIIIVKKPSKDDLSETNKSLNRFIANLPEAYKSNKPAVILNKAKEEDIEKLECNNLIKDLNNYRDSFTSDVCDLIGVVPYTTELGHIRVSDLAKQINATVIHDGNLEDRRVSSICLSARHVENVVHRFKTGTLIVAPADRSDILIAASLAVHKGIELAGIILTCNLKPKDSIIEFCNSAFDSNSGLPILNVNTDSFQTATLLNNLNSAIPVSDYKRIDLVMNTVARFIDSDWLRTRISSDIKKRLSPVAFKHQLARKARKASKRILLPEGEEERTIRAAIECSQRLIARCVLMGERKKIENRIKGLGYTLPQDLEILEPKDYLEQYVTPLYELRKHKGVTKESAKEALEDTIVLATVMVATGDADGLVSGAIHSTAHTIRPALRIIKPAPGNKVVSSIFFMCLPDQVYIYGDCAVNPDPTSEQLAEIAIQSANSAKAFGIEPKVAMISYSTLGSGSGSDVDKVQEATRIVKEKAPELLVDGPLQYDAATTLSVAQKKAPDSCVAGQANVLIFPDLNTGNTTYKAVQRSANVDSIGPMLQGLNKPVNDLSRGTTVEDIIYTIALTAIQADSKG